jgi:hypothetical protein
VGIFGAMADKRVCLYGDNAGIIGSAYRHSLHRDFAKMQLIS